MRCSGKLSVLHSLHSFPPATLPQPLPSEPSRSCRFSRHKFKYDALYIKQQSFWLDLKLIALSLWITVRGTWEYRGRKF